MGAISYEQESRISSRKPTEVEENDQTHNVDFLDDEVPCQETEQLWQNMHQNNTFTKSFNKGSLQKIQRKKSPVLLEGYVEGSSDSSEDELKRTKSLTDDDLDELKGCLDLGFGFSYDEIPELCNTLPALELCYSMSQRFLDEHQKSPERSSPTVAEAASPSPFANWKISSPGELIYLFIWCFVGSNKDFSCLIWFLNIWNFKILMVQMSNLSLNYGAFWHYV